MLLEFVDYKKLFAFNVALINGVSFLVFKIIAPIFLLIIILSQLFS